MTTVTAAPASVPDPEAGDEAGDKSDERQQVHAIVPNEPGVVSPEELAQGIDAECAVGLAEGQAAEAEEEHHEEQLYRKLDDKDDAHVGDDPAEGQLPLVCMRPAFLELVFFPGVLDISGLALFPVFQHLVDDGVQDWNERQYLAGVVLEVKSAAQDHEADRAGDGYGKAEEESSHRFRCNCKSQSSNCLKFGFGLYLLLICYLVLDYRCLFRPAVSLPRSLAGLNNYIFFA